MPKQIVSTQVIELLKLYRYLGMGNTHTPDGHLLRDAIDELEDTINNRRKTSESD
jgi:hypothetical protein